MRWIVYAVVASLLLSVFVFAGDSNPVGEARRLSSSSSTPSSGASGGQTSRPEETPSFDLAEPASGLSSTARHSQSSQAVPGLDRFRRVRIALDQVLQLICPIILLAEFDEGNSLLQLS